jgi:uncharacterized membrane protein
MRLAGTRLHKTSIAVGIDLAGCAAVSFIFSKQVQILYFAMSTEKHSDALPDLVRWC